jgi:hypothetical protein
MCQQWRQSPDYNPQSLLLTLRDVDLAALDTGSDDEQGAAMGGSARRQRRRSGPMSEERRQAISRALQSKGAKSAEHKRQGSHVITERL